MRIRALTSGLLATLFLLTWLGPATAADPVTALSLSAPVTVRVGQPTVLRATLTVDGAPQSGQVVQFQVRSTGAWTPLGSTTTDANGVATMSRTTPLGAVSYRAVTTGPPAAESTPLTVTGYRAASTLTLTAAAWWVIDERSRTLTASWHAEGRAVTGVVTLQQRLPGAAAYTNVASRRTGGDGRAAFVVRPRSDRLYRVVGGDGASWLGAASAPRLLDNRPAAAPVAYPRSAPRPIALAPNRRAVGKGANPRVTKISTSVWRSMLGRSWHRGCPVGRSGLRLIKINYWGYDGYRYRGELVVNAAIARKSVGALRDMYAGRYPIRRMYRIDRFGWSSYLRGGDDYASMRRGNTSGFNCRGVVGNPRVMSPHARGRSIDLNTWENPYASRTGIVPNTWWYSRSHPRIAWRSNNHPVLRIWRKHGFRWTYRVLDSQHFDGRRVPIPTATMLG